MLGRNIMRRGSLRLRAVAAGPVNSPIALPGTVWPLGSAVQARVIFANGAPVTGWGGASVSTPQGDFTVYLGRPGAPGQFRVEVRMISAPRTTAKSNAFSVTAV